MTRSDMFKNAARDIAQLLYTDSLIPVSTSLPLLHQALMKDDRLPTAEEKQMMAYGVDEEVDVIAEVFPHTSAVLNSFF